MGACESKENLFPTTTTGDEAEAEADPSQIHIDNAQKKTVEMSIDIQQRIDILPTNTFNLNLGEDGSMQTTTHDTVTKQTLLSWKEKISELSNEIVAIEQERKAADVEYKRTVSDLRRELSKARATNLAQKKLIREKEHAVSRTQADIKEMVTAIALLKKQSLARKNQMQSISGTLLKVTGEHHTKLKFTRTNKKHLIFTSKINRLFYYDDASTSKSPRSPKATKTKDTAAHPKMMHIRSVTTRHDAIDEHMQRPWFYVVGDKRSALFVAEDSKTRDVWVKFIQQSLRKAPKKDPSVLKGAAMSMVPFGQQQSPINLCTAKCYKLPKIDVNDGSGRQCTLKFSYPRSVRNCTLTNTGHTVRVNIDAKLSGNACTVTLRNKTYTLQQFHFHTPAEHTIDDALHDMELHLVHTNEAGEIAVLGFLFSTKQKHRKPRLKLARSRSRSRRSLQKTRAQTMDGRKKSKGAKSEVETRARPKSVNLGAPKSSRHGRSRSTPRSSPAMHVHVVSASEISDVTDVSEDEREHSEVTEVEVSEVGDGGDGDVDEEEAAEAERERLNLEEDMGKFYKDYSEKQNEFLAQFWEELPTKVTSEDVPLYKALSFDGLFETAASDLVRQADAQHLDVEMHIFEYTGSLTTPPYTEGVQWLVSKKTHFINDKQLNKLSSCWGHENNARALQNECGRTISLRSQCSLHV